MGVYKFESPDGDIEAQVEDQSYEEAWARLVRRVSANEKDPQVRFIIKPSNIPVHGWKCTEVPPEPEPPVIPDDHNWVRGPQAGDTWHHIYSYDPENVPPKVYAECAREFLLGQCVTAPHPGAERCSTCVEIVAEDVSIPVG